MIKGRWASVWPARMYVSTALVDMAQAACSAAVQSRIDYLAAYAQAAMRDMAREGTR